MQILADFFLIMLFFILAGLLLGAVELGEKFLERIYRNGK